MQKVEQEIPTKVTKNQLDKGVANSLPALNQEALKQGIIDIEEFLKTKTPYRYLMLLCNELRYYTIFEVSALTTTSGAAQQIVKFIETDSFLKTVGRLKLIEADGNPDLVEIWIGDKHFGLFPCDTFVVKI